MKKEIKRNISSVRKRKRTDARPKSDPTKKTPAIKMRKCKSPFHGQSAEAHCLNISQTNPGFYVSAVQVLRKHWGKRRNCS